MFSFVPEIRKAIYTTNTFESLNMTLRKIIKNRAMFPSDEAVFKILYLVKNISKRWTMPIHGDALLDGVADDGQNFVAARMGRFF